MDKVVIITGAAGGLGSEIAKRFGSDGAKVVVNDIGRAQAAAENLVDEINKGLGEAFAYQADVRSYEQLAAMVEEAVRRWSRVDVAVNVAGGNLSMLTRKENKLLLEHSEKDWDIVVDVNLKGSFNCLKAVAPQMIKQRDGHIILISSGIGLRPRERMSSYAAAKAGVFGLMKAAALELGEYNIKVNVVNPGLIIHESLPANAGVQVSEGYVNETMLHRLSNREDFADFVVYLSQKNNISGQIFNLDSRVLF